MSLTTPFVAKAWFCSSGASNSKGHIALRFAVLDNPDRNRWLRTLLEWSISALLPTPTSRPTISCISPSIISYPELLIFFSRDYLQRERARLPWNGTKLFESRRRVKLHTFWNRLHLNAVATLPRASSNSRGATASTIADNTSSRGNARDWPKENTHSSRNRQLLTNRDNEKQSIFVLTRVLEREWLNHSQRPSTVRTNNLRDCYEEAWLRSESR